MQILLNLLPQAQKEKNARRFRFRFFLWQTMLLLGLEIFYVAFLGGVFYLLDQEVKLAEQANQVFQEDNSEMQKLTVFQEKFKETNARTSEVGRFYDNHLRWSNLFVILEQLTQPQIVIVDILTREYTITLNGQAATRDDFLVFEAALKPSDCISDVKVPISSLFSKKEIEFQVDFNLKRECLLRNIQ